MKKMMDLSKRKAYVRKEPVYHQREEIALAHADRVVLRVFINGEWKEKEHFPSKGHLLYELTSIQSQLRHSPNLKKVCLYVGGIDPNSGERMIASVPHDWVPEAIRVSIVNK